MPKYKYDSGDSPIITTERSAFKCKMDIKLSY